MFSICFVAVLVALVLPIAAEAQVYSSGLFPASSESNIRPVGFDYFETDASGASFGSGHCDAGCDDACGCETSCCDTCSSACGGCDSCCNCIWCRDKLFGDWHGMRSCLAQKGIVVDLQYTQFYQAVTDDGSYQTGRYGGKLDYMFTFLGEPLGLNEGFSATVHAETRYGQDVNADAGALAFPNGNMLWPSEDSQTAVTGLIFMQALSEKFVLTAGKYNCLDLFQMLYPHAGRGVDTFMNLNLLMPPTLLRTTGLSINGGGFLVMKDRQRVQSAVLVYDTQGSATTVAPDLFDQGMVILGYHRIFTECCGREGSHAILANYSNRTYASTDRTDWTILPGQGLTAAPQTGSWTVSYLWDQILWSDCCNENRNLRLFTFGSVADRNPSPYGWSAAVSLKANGLIHCRPGDSMGAGYFYGGLNPSFKDLVSATPPFDLEDVHGIEIYYNAAITPWFHLTGDFQVIDNQNVVEAPAVVFGLRAKIDL